jgi:DNA-directed RNA polymerase specialized sigma24 family protein
MKTHHPKKSKFTTCKFKRHSGRSCCPDHDLEMVAEELVQRAESRLPNGVMTGHLDGYEDDIRQEAVLLALKWYIKQRRGIPDHEVSDWNPAQAICAALKYCKLDLIKKNTAEQHARAAWAHEIHKHDLEGGSHTEEWSPAEIRLILEKSILQALKNGRISHANASVAIQVYVYGVQVKALAKHLNRTKGAIHQHLVRVRQEIPEIVRSLRDDHMM